MGPTPACPEPQNPFHGPKKLTLTPGGLVNSVLYSLGFSQALDLPSHSDLGSHLRRRIKTEDPQGLHP